MTDILLKTVDLVKSFPVRSGMFGQHKMRLMAVDHVNLSIRKGVRPEDAFGRHWCFKAERRNQVDAFWGAGIAAGGTSEGAPGLRQYHPSYYAAFLRDPDGNRIEAVCHHPV